MADLNCVANEPSPMLTTLAQLFSLVAALPLGAAGQANAGWQLSGDAPITGICTDSRKVKPGDLFVALRGDQFDAHDFLPQVVQQAAAILVHQLPDGIDVPHILVPDTRRALGQLGRAWRAQFALPTIAVTGSNGKTTVKEMIAAILATAFGADARLATRGNLNNDIGVPLTLLSLRAAHQAAVVELGMNHPGEIAYLADLACPTVALINNAQREHLEFMQDVASVAQENGSVIASLAPDGVAVFPADDAFSPLWHNLARERRCKVLTFGLAEGANVSCDYRSTDFGSQLRVSVKTDQCVRMFPMKLGVAGSHNVRNALAAIACAVAIGIDVLVIARALEAFEPVGGRLQRKRAGNGAFLIDDTYNANPDSVRAAISVLAQAAAPRILVLGDMGEVGNQGPEFHREVGQFALQHGLEQVFCIGSLTTHTRDAFGPGAQHVEHMADLLKLLEQAISPNATVLVKGSRFMKMERVVEHFVRPLAPSPDQPSQGIH